MHLKLWKQNLWLATGGFGESGWGPGMGLVRYDTHKGHVEPFAKNHPLATAFITAMAKQNSDLWVGTPGRFFALDMDSRTLRVWRVVPILELKTSNRVSSRPGGEVRSSLASGVYEVRWVGPGSVEVLTPDCTEGYAQAEWISNPRSRGSPDLMDVAASDKWGVASFRTYRSAPKPGPLPAPDGWFFRVPAEPVAPPDGEWQRARVCAGWVEARPEDVRLTIEKVH